MYKKNKLNKTLVIIICILSLLIIGFGIYFIYLIKSGSITINKKFTINNTVWYSDSDNSSLVFPNKENFVWYASNDFENEDTYMAGAYDFYTGKEAYDYIKQIYSKEETLPTYYENNCLLVLYVVSSLKDGVETLDLDNDSVPIKYFYGYYYDDYMTYIDLETSYQYEFYNNVNSTSLSNIKSYIKDAEDVDMSAYSALSTSNNFKEISLDTLLNTIGDINNNSIIYIGYSNCKNCQKIIKDLQDAAIKYNQTIYYLDCSTAFPTDNEYFKLVEALKVLLKPSKDDDENIIYRPEYKKDDNGNYLLDDNGNYIEVTDNNGDVVYSDVIKYEIYTPFIFRIIKGQLDADNFIVGYSDSSDYESLVSFK